MEPKLKIAVFVDYDNIEIGVKSTLQREFDVSLVLDALKERGDVVAKYAYANWERQVGATRQMAESAVQMVQRVPSPRGDKNGADINLALDTLEMAFTHPHVNAFAVVSGDSDFISLVNKLKEYGKTIFVVGGRAFTSTILQKNCHEFISYESLLEEPQKAPRQQARPVQPHSPQPQQQQPQQQPPRRHEPLDLALVMPLVERALQVLERREVQPQLGILKSTMLQLDATFTERDYGCGSFKEFVDKLKKADYVNVSEVNRRYIIERKGSQPAKPDRPARRPDECLPILRDVLETHRLEMESGVAAHDLAGWVQIEHAGFDWKEFGFQEFSELLNFAQDKLVVRVEPQEEGGLKVLLGAEFYPSEDLEVSKPVVVQAPSKRSRKNLTANLPMRSPADAAVPRKRTARKKAATAETQSSHASRRPRKRSTSSSSGSQEGSDN